MNENPEKYLDPQRNIEELNLKLEKVRVEIQNEETRINSVTIYECEEDISSNSDKTQNT